MVTDFTQGCLYYHRSKDVAGAVRIRMRLQRDDYSRRDGF